MQIINTCKYYLKTCYLLKRLVMICIVTIIRNRKRKLVEGLQKINRYNLITGDITDCTIFFSAPFHGEQVMVSLTMSFKELLKNWIVFEVFLLHVLFVKIWLKILKCIKQCISFSYRGCFMNVNLFSFPAQSASVLPSKSVTGLIQESISFLRASSFITLFLMSAIVFKPLICFSNSLCISWRMTPTDCKTKFKTDITLSTGSMLL